MSPILSSQGIVLAMVMAVFGTVVLLVLRLQKPPPPILSRFSLPQSSIFSSDHVKAKVKKRKKRVHFAEDVVDPTGNSEDYRKLRSNNNNGRGAADSSFEIKMRNWKFAALKKGGRVVQEMPTNRVALYNGILRDLVHKKRSVYSSSQYKLRSNYNNGWGAADSSFEIKMRNWKSAALKKGGRVVQEMPVNKVALYNGILRDRVHKMHHESSSSQYITHVMKDESRPLILTS